MFPSTEKKSPFSKIVGYVWTGPWCFFENESVYNQNHIQRKSRWRRAGNLNPTSFPFIIVIKCYFPLSSKICN